MNFAVLYMGADLALAQLRWRVRFGGYSHGKSSYQGLSWKQGQETSGRDR